MKSRFSRTWNSSVKPRKQRKYRYNAPLHLRSKFLSVNLSKDLKTQYKTRNLRVRKGDTVRVKRGSYTGKEGKIETVNVTKSIVFIEGIELTRRDGSKRKIPFQPSNLQIVDLNLKDAKRKAKLQNIKPEDK